MIKKGQILTLTDNNKYLVLSKVLYKNVNYLYLIDINDNTKFKICCENIDNNNISVSIINDNKLIEKLILLFTKDIKEILKRS